MCSAGSLAPTRVIRSLSNQQAVQVVSNHYFDDDDEDAVCMTSLFLSFTSYITPIISSTSFVVKTKCRPDGGKTICRPLSSIINDLPEFCSDLYTKLYIYADDTKLFRYISNSLDQHYLQSGINKVGDWAKEWLLKLNVEKCCGMSFAANISNVCTTKYYIK